MNHVKALPELTKLEKEIFESSLNYTDREGQLSDNYSNYDAKGIAAELGTSAQAIGGATSTLIQKGYMFDDGEGMVWLTEEGVNAYFDNRENS